MWRHGAVALAAAALVACGGGERTGTAVKTVAIDGSSTVFPITEAVAEEFQRAHPDVRVTVGISGTGGGFKKFTVGETDINDASRPIKASEAEQAAAERHRATSSCRWPSTGSPSWSTRTTRSWIVSPSRS